MPDGVPIGIDGMKAAEIVDRIGEYVRDCDDERKGDGLNAELHSSECSNERKMT